MEILVTVTEAVRIRTPIRHWIQPHMHIVIENQGGRDNSGSTSIAESYKILNIGFWIHGRKYYNNIGGQMWT